MCGRLNVIDDPGVRDLCDQLEIDLWPNTAMHFSRFVRATDRLSIVYETDQGRVMRSATWWLLLDALNEGEGTVFKPSRYTSFNSRYDKLNQPGSAGYVSYRQHRCVIPVAGFGETMRLGGQSYYYDMTASPNTGLAMGGLYRIWRGRDAAGKSFEHLSCSVVTLPPHPKFQRIHPKSSPLMLSMDDGSLQCWLDHRIREPALLDSLLVPRIRHRLWVQPIDKPASHQPVAEGFFIQPD